MAAPDAKEKLLASAKSTIRSVLLTSKEGLSLGQLQSHYQELLFAPLPVKQLGYPNASALLNAMPDVCRKTYDRSGMELYKAVADDSTSHIAQMVSRQRGKKPKKGKNTKFSSYSRQPKSTHSFQTSRKYVPSNYSRGGHVQNAYNKPSSHYSSKFASTSVNKRSAYQPQASTQKPNNQPKSESSTTKAVTSLTITISNKPNPNRPQTEEDVRSNLRDILKQQSAGIWLHMLKDVYHGFVGLNFPPQYLKCVTEWTDIVDVQQQLDKDILYLATASSVAEAQTKASAEISNEVSPFAEAIRPPISFRERERCDVYMSHVEPATCKVYVHRADSCINELTESMTSYFKSQDRRTYTDVSDNCVCAATDSVYQSITRACVKHVDRQKAEVELFYPDFGNTEMQSLDKVQPLPVKFASEEAQAVPVHLHGLVPIDNKKFTRDLSSMTNQQKLELMCLSKEGECSVLLFHPDQPEKTINQLLIDTGCAYFQAGTQKKGCASKPAISPVRAPSPLSTQPTSSISAQGSGVSSYKPVLAPLPASEYWTVMVTHIQSVSQLYLRIKDDFLASFTEFQEEIERTCANIEPITFLSMGSHYIACVSFDEDAPGWYRVKAIDLLDANTVCCEFIDYGFHHDVERKRMYPISKKHARVPCQARPCVLYGMDQIQDDEGSRLLSKLQELTDDKSLIAELITVEQEVPHVVLFDTSGDDDIEINKEVGKVLAAEALQALLPQEGQTTDVSLTYVERDGTFYVQTVGPANLLLQQLMNTINEYYSKQNTASEDFITNPQVGQVVCARYDGMWYRATINKVLSDRKVSVFYGDYGNSATLPTRQLRRLPPFIKDALTLPMQSMSCKLSGLAAWNDDVGSEAATLMAATSTFVLTTVKSATETTPALVQLTHNDLDLNKHLLKIYEDSIAQVSQLLEQCNLAATIPLPDSPGTPPGSPPLESSASTSSRSHEMALADLNHNGAGDYLSSKLQLLCQTTAEGDFKRFNLQFVCPPDVGEYWDLFVTDSSTPHHFIVIPHANIKQLNSLGDRIHSEYQGSPEVPFTPTPGQLCAGYRAADGFWYRVIVLPGQVGDKHKVVFGDYGNYDYLAIDKLRPLHKAFGQMPLQAVKASLYGLEPTAGNVWSEQACSEFVSLCNEKSLVATIRAVDRTRSLVSDRPSVFVDLHDTSSDTQQSIGQLLVSNGHAKYRQE